MGYTAKSKILTTLTGVHKNGKNIEMSLGREISGRKSEGREEQSHGNEKKMARRNEIHFY